MSESEACCWQCSEHNVFFVYILNVINDLKKKKISSNFENILDRFNVNDEYNNITKEQLEEILSYACKSKYVSTANYNTKLSYRVNDKDIEGACNICGEKLLPYKTEDFPANKIVESITRDTFESLAYEIYDLKSKVHGLTLNINERRSQGGDDKHSNLIHKLKEENSILLKRIKCKDEQISFFMSEISKNKNFHSNLNSSRINKSDHVTMETRKTNDGWQFAKSNSFSNTRGLNNYSNLKEIPLYNRYNDLINEELCNDDGDECDNVCFNGVALNNDFNYVKRTRPELVVNEHCDNDTLLRRDVVKKTYPGNSTYAEVTERGKKVY